MRVGTFPADFVVCYQSKTFLAGASTQYIASSEWPFDLTENISEAQRFGQSFAQALAKKHPIYDDLHKDAEVMAVKRLNNSAA